MIQAWLCDSLKRIFPSSKPNPSPLRLDVARGEAFSFQVAVIIDTCMELGLRITCDPGIQAVVRRVGYVPLSRRSIDTSADEIEGDHVIPGLVPDPLFEDMNYSLPTTSANAYWISGKVDINCRPGLKKVRGALIPRPPIHEPAKTLTAEIQVHPLRIQPRHDFDVTHWFYADALCDWYKVDPWAAVFRQIVQPYMRNLVSHGQNVIYVPVFTPPLDGVKRPTQLLGVRRTGQNKYEFDWTHVSRWIKTAQQCGLEKFEWCHLFTQWGAKNAIRLYEKKRGEDVLLWDPDTSATGKTYRAFLAQYLPQLHQFLIREKILHQSLFHLSDEPHGNEHLENYRKARALLKELAPWMKVMDALSDIRFAQQKLVDMPIPSIRVAKQFWEKQIPCWHYFCCSPRGRYLNRLLETPLAKIRMAGWLFYRFQPQGFLHWGYNYWYKSQTRQLINPFFESDGLASPGWAHGDPFMVYPGPDGPIDSIRWEIFAESLQDYQLLQTLQVPPEALAKDLMDYNEFPKSVAWLRRQRRRLLCRASSGGHLLLQHID